MGEIPDDTEEAILQTLLRIRAKDPLIYQSNVYFFQRGEGEEEGEGADAGGDKGDAPKKEKPLYLKDVLAKQVWGRGVGRGGVRGKGKRGDDQSQRTCSLTKASKTNSAGSDGDGGRGKASSRLRPLLKPLTAQRFLFTLTHASQRTPVRSWAAVSNVAIVA